MIKPRIVLIPDYVNWILGTWAIEIYKKFNKEFDILIYPFGEINEDKSKFREIAYDFDIVHCLSPWHIKTINDLLPLVNGRKPIVISSIHHIISLSDVSDCLLADRVMTVCKLYYIEVLNIGLSSNKVKMVHNGVNTDFYRPLDKQKSRRMLGIDPHLFVIGFSAKASSNVEDRKGIDYFLDIIQNLTEELKSRLQIIISGPGWEKIIQNLRIININVKYFPFLPFQSMPSFYSGMDVYLVTSRIEGGPVPLLEAMSCGIIPVSTRVGVVSEVIVEGNNGYIIPHNDFIHAQKVIVNIVNGISNDLDRIRESARMTIVTNFQWNTTLNGLRELYALEQPINSRSMRLNFRWVNSVFRIKDDLRWKLMMHKSNSAGRPGYYLKKRLIESCLRFYSYMLK